jgi:heme exporter protein A
MRLAGSDVTCVRGGREVFAGLDFAVERGEALAVTGRNGAGKSSLLRLIAGLLAAARGSISLQGGDNELSLAERCHFLGHRDAIKPSLTVMENLQFWRDFLGGESGEPVNASLDAIGIGHLASVPASFLSAGQRRRLGLARLVAVRRPVWLLDEPTSALDTQAQALLAALMTAHLRSGGLIVAATHDALGISARELRIGVPA